jgi:hypothetical protein
MDTPNMITLPPKYLKPIYMNVNSTDIQTTTSTTSYATDYSTTQNYQFEQTTTSDYQIPTTDYNTTTSTDYGATTDYNTTTDYSASISQPAFSTTETTLAATPSMGAQSGFKLIRRGSGITANEQNSIVSTAMNIMQSGLTPISNQTARGVKKKLGGDWLVIVYPEGKSIDFNMTCVQGNDYLYFILNSYAFQVCRLK